VDGVYFASRSWREEVLLLNYDHDGVLAVFLLEKDSEREVRCWGQSSLGPLGQGLGETSSEARRSHLRDEAKSFTKKYELGVVLTPVILATRVTEIRRTEVQS
jgi:hypothetical protein